MKQLKTVVIGGGTGIYPVTAALKNLPTDISTVIAVSDSGGSTGRIRDEFGFQPVGDLRQSLAALAEGQGEEWIRKLLLYRFNKGEGLKGHNLGNLILTALQDMTGDTSEALYRAQQIFRLTGQVIPATNDNVDLEIIYEDGSVLVGEDYLNPESDIEKKVVEVRLTPTAKINPYATTAIAEADVIIIGPGDYFASLLAALLSEGTQAAFAQSKAHLIYIVNLMTRHHQTDHMSAADHVKGIENAIGKKVDSILMNNHPLPKKIIDLYAQKNEFEVKDDLTNDTRSLRADIITEESAESTDGDLLHRSYLRHDSEKLHQAFVTLFPDLFQRSNQTPSTNQPSLPQK